MPVTVS